MDIFPYRQQYLQPKRPGYTSVNTGNLGHLHPVHESVHGAEASEIVFSNN